MTYYIDGYTIWSNPSETGGGYTIFDSNNNLIKTVEVLKEGFTNNEAELIAVNECAKLCEIGDTIITDSTNTIKWVSKKPNLKKKKRRDLYSIKLETFELIANKNINLVWKPREENLAGIYNENTFNA